MTDYISRDDLISRLRKERAAIEIREDDEKAFSLGVHQGYVFAIHDIEAIPGKTTQQGFARGRIVVLG